MDGCRGIAAVMVVCFHCGYLSFGYWGVTLFFVISGYCILATADSCLAKDKGVREFAFKRFHRIYPPYLCALIFFIGTRLLKLLLSHENQLAHFTALQFLQNATLTQWLTLLAHPNPRGENPSLMVTAFWSLNYEVQFYAVVAMFLALARRFRRANLNAMILALTGVGLIWLRCRGGVQDGLFIEYWPVFGFGCLVFMRLCKFTSRAARFGVDAFLAGLAAICIVALSLPKPVRIFGYFTEPLLVGACFALLLIVSRGVSNWVCKTPLGRVLSFLGLISYSLYLIHQFNLNLASTVVKSALHDWPPTLVVGVAVVGFHIALATAFWALCERPFLNERVPLSRVLARRPRES